MDISKGSLDDISRPPSNRSRQGSQASSKMFGSAQAVNRRLIESPGTFQVLHPDNSEDCDIIEVEDYSGASDLDILDDFTDDEDEFFESEEGEYIDASNEAETPQATGGEKPSLPTQQLNSVEHYLSKQLVIAGYNGDNDDVEVDSEEERDICKEIKEEIKRQVKGEMQDELKVYELPEKKEGAAAEDRDADLTDLEPKLREAIIKMRKLDRILLKKMKREKDVKRDRMRLTKRLREELDELSRENKESGKTELKEVKNNTFKFLALAPPPSHNEGITLDDDDDEPPITPVFRTQVPDEDFQTKDAKESSRPQGNRSRVESNRSEDSRASGPLGSELGNSTSRSRASKSSKKSGKGKKKNQDFIKRNIQLASDAANPIAMTDDEKNRLEDILKTMDMETIAEEQSDENPFQLAVPPGEGYTPAPDDQKALEDIDKRLKSLMAPEEFEALKSPRGTTSFQHCLFTRTDMRSSVDVDKLGEQVLKETKEERDMRIRMEQIEKDLASLSIHADLEFSTPALSEDQLEMLLGQYARSVASSASQLDTISENGEIITERSVQSVDIYENPPTLPENVLQQLLSEAREQLMFDEHAHTPNTPNESDDRKVEKILNTARDELAMDSLTDEQIQDLLRSARESSRSSSRSTLRPNSSSEILTQRNDLSHRDEDRVILPEINQTNGIVAQKVNNTDRLNNQAKKSNSERRSANMGSANVVWNSFSEDRLSSRRDSNGRSSASSLNGLHFEGRSPRPPVSNGSLGPPLVNGQAHGSRSSGQGHSARSPRSTRSQRQNGSGRPRNLQPISTHLDLDGLSDEEF
ncbi:fibrous sheath-interacting protein 1-like [Lineus longissimus]|uniref:fibrous sheath-interacting protein 1-like n=1 Tax=Lineus longissimus TaxID=88925 RepID=UPI002B4ECA5D